jgi:hypothetical protein
VGARRVGAYPGTKDGTSATATGPRLRKPSCMDTGRGTASPPPFAKASSPAPNSMPRRVDPSIKPARSNSPAVSRNPAIRSAKDAKGRMASSSVAVPSPRRSSDPHRRASSGTSTIPPPSRQSSILLRTLPSGGTGPPTLSARVAKSTVSARPGATKGRIMAFDTSIRPVRAVASPVLAGASGTCREIVTVSARRPSGPSMSRAARDTSWGVSGSPKA